MLWVWQPAFARGWASFHIHTCQLCSRFPMLQHTYEYVQYHSCCIMQAGEVERAVENAVRLGIRHIDTGVEQSASYKHNLHSIRSVALWGAQYVPSYSMTCTRGRHHGDVTSNRMGRASRCLSALLRCTTAGVS